MKSTPHRLPTVQAAILLALALALPGCAHRVERTLSTPDQISTLDHASPYLKVHMKDGGLYLLSRWSVGRDRVCTGIGTRLDASRRVIATDSVRIPIDSVALFETNVVKTSPLVASMAVLTGVSLGVTFYCISNPKSCFGSCPTFYVTDGTRPVLQAEGFSSSIAPCLEATDVDALWRAAPRSRDLEVLVTNEALETHVIRRADILAAPRPPGGRVVATRRGEFREALRLIPPLRATAPEGDCLAALARHDGVERASVADSTDLAAREVIDLEFPAAPDTALGLVIASRQSLLSTFLYYQALAYLGRSAGDWLAALQRGDTVVRAQSNGIWHALGGVEVLVPARDGSWAVAGVDQETGPIATDVRVVPLPPAPPGPVHVRLRLTRGAWRLDQVCLAALGRRVEPLRVKPCAASRDGAPDPAALAALRDSAGPLTTFPGDRIRLRYRLPEDYERCELFLESRGYYLEWMRNEWLAEENPARLALMALQPEVALRLLAPAYKAQEASMEEAFWRSRYGHP